MKNINKSKRKGILGFFANRTVTTKIILFSCLTSVLGFFIFAYYPDLAGYFYLNAGMILQGKNLWTLITHIFLHANLIHLFVNMFSLYFIGQFLEVIIGGKRLFRFYLIAGILAGLIFVGGAYLGEMFGIESVLGSLNISAVGASGALFGLLGILAVLVPKKKVALIAGPLIIIVVSIITIPLIYNYLSPQLSDNDFTPFIQGSVDNLYGSPTSFNITSTSSLVKVSLNEGNNYTLTSDNSGKTFLFNNDSLSDGIYVARFYAYDSTGSLIDDFYYTFGVNNTARTASKFLEYFFNIIMFIMIFAMFSPNPRTRRFAVPIVMSLWIAPIIAIVPLVMVSFFVELPIGNTAHFGGLIVGLVYGYYLRRKYQKKVALLQRVFK